MPRPSHVLCALFGSCCLVFAGCSDEPSANNDAMSGPDGAAGTPNTGGSAGLAAGGSGGAGAGSGGAAGGAAGTGGGLGGTDGGVLLPDGAAGGIQATESPWGIAPSHSSSVGIDSWASEIAASGIDWIRGFDQGNTEGVLATAAANGFQVSGFFFLSDPGPAATFPVTTIPAWEAYVTDMVQRTRSSVRNWEVWNEPPNFSENKSPEAYASIVVAAYDAVKAVDPTIQVGLAAQSVNLNFLALALDAGAADHFDYVTVHPYETMGLVDQGWEAEYMSIVPTIRKMLAEKNPAKEHVPVWFTEVGEPVQGAITAEHQADTLVKAYVMGIAQGVLRIHWFEPLDGDSGPFGLIAGPSGSAPKRPSYTAVSELIRHIGQLPRYLGWLLLDGEHYAFVFDGPNGPVMVAWAGPGETRQVAFGSTVRVVQPGTATSSDVDAYDLTASPILVTGFPEALVAEATSNLGSPFPWGGDFTNAASVTYTASGDEQGLHPIGAANVISIDGSPARDVSQSPAQSFTVDPNFCSYTATALRITAVVRRNGAAAAGFNLKYESTTGWKGTGSWYTIPGSDQWYTQTWSISDTQFVGKWGYNFAFDSDSTANSAYSIQSVTVTKE